jgi:hypothetical protein
MKAKTVIMKINMLEYMLTDNLGREVKLTHNNIDAYRIEILKTPCFGRTIFRHIKTYLSMRNDYFLKFENAFHAKLMKEERKAPLF